MAEEHLRPDPQNTRSQPDVPYHAAQSLAALKQAPTTANGLSAHLTVASVHAQLAVADAIERQTATLRHIASLLDPSRGEP